MTLAGPLTEHLRHPVSGSKGAVPRPQFPNPEMAKFAHGKKDRAKVWFECSTMSFYFRPAGRHDVCCDNIVIKCPIELDHDENLVCFNRSLKRNEANSRLYGPMLMDPRRDCRISRDWQTPECADDVAEKSEGGHCYNLGRVDRDKQHLDRRGASRDDFYRTSHTEFRFF